MTHTNNYTITYITWCDEYHPRSLLLPASRTASARHRTAGISTATENVFVYVRHRRLMTFVFERLINIRLLLLLLLLLSLLASEICQSSLPNCSAVSTKYIRPSGPSLLGVRRLGTHYRTVSVIHRSAAAALDVVWRLYFSRNTSVLSAIEMLHDIALY